MKKTVSQAKMKDLIFYIAMAALPLLQYIIFYVAVNFNSLLLSIQKYEVVGNGYRYVFSGGLFDNFAKVFSDLAKDPAMASTLKNSLVAYLAQLLIITPLALVFSFYVVKKLPGNGIFRIILFLPTIICSVILVYIFQVLADEIIPQLIINFFDKDGDFTKYQLLANIDTRFTSILCFSIFLGFGVNVLMYTSAMSGVSSEMLEACYLDGCGDFSEFWHIILPSVWPTLTTFIVVGVAGFFTNQMYLYDLRGESADSSIWTLGYFMYKNTVSGNETFDLYPYLSAMGIVFTLVAAPVSFFVKWTMEKYGPKDE